MGKKAAGAASARKAGNANAGNAAARKSSPAPHTVAKAAAASKPVDAVVAAPLAPGATNVSTGVPRPRANSTPACELRHVAMAARSAPLDEFVATDPLEFNLQPAYACAIAALGAPGLPASPLRGMFPAYTDNAFVRAWAADVAAEEKEKAAATSSAKHQQDAPSTTPHRSLAAADGVGNIRAGLRCLPKNADPCGIDVVIFKGDNVPPPAYWRTAAEMLDAETPTRRAVRAVAAHRSAQSTACCTPQKSTAKRRPAASAVDAEEEKEGSPNASASDTDEEGTAAASNRLGGDGAPTEPPLRFDSPDPEGSDVRPGSCRGSARNGGGGVMLKPGTSHGGPACNAADPRSQLYREGRAEVARLRQLQQQQQQQQQQQPSSATSERSASSSLPSPTVPSSTNHRTAAAAPSSKYSVQAEAEMLKHLQVTATAERGRADEATERAARLEAEVAAMRAELAVEAARREEAEQARALLRNELETTRARSGHAIEVARVLEMEKRGLEEDVRVLNRDVAAYEERIRHISDSSKKGGGPGPSSDGGGHASSRSGGASPTTVTTSGSFGSAPAAAGAGNTTTANHHAAEQLSAALEAAAKARSEADSVKQRLGTVGVDLANERKAFLKLKGDHQREVKRLSDEVGVVRDMLRKANERADEAGRALVRHQHETYALVQLLEEQTRASRGIATSVVADDENTRRRRIADNENAIRVQLGALHATTMAAIH